VVDRRNNWVIATPIDANDKDVRNHAKYVRSFAIVSAVGTQRYPNGLLRQLVYSPVQVPDSHVPIVGKRSIFAFQTKVETATHHAVGHYDRFLELVRVDSGFVQCWKW